MRCFLPTIPSLQIAHQKKRKKTWQHKDPTFFKRNKRDASSNAFRVMPSAAFAFLLQRQIWNSSRKEAGRHLSQAKRLLSSHDPADVQLALSFLDSALKICPQWDKAIELKARALLYLRRFKDVASLLRDFIPSSKNERVAETLNHPGADKENVKLLPVPLENEKASLFHCLPSTKSVWISFTRKKEKEQWKYIVLGQACCHLGMMEDAMVLLSNGKRAASAAIRKQSNNMREDGFVADAAVAAGDSDLVCCLLENIKFLLRRRTTALAALQAGLFNEAARHFTKIIEGRRGTPQGFIAECYMHRAMAYHAASRLVDAIADCNRALALNPACTEALSTRSTIYETIGCLTDCLNDLGQLKTLYGSLLHNEGAHDASRVQPSNGLDMDLQGCLDFVTSKAAVMQERCSINDTADYYMILGLSRGCSRAEVERAYLLLILRHRPDKAAYFVDRCEFVDERDVDIVKDEARCAGLKLFRLIQRAYIGVITVITQEEISLGLKQTYSELMAERAISMGLVYMDEENLATSTSSSSSDEFLCGTERNLLEEEGNLTTEEQKMLLDGYDDV